VRRAWEYSVIAGLFPAVSLCQENLLKLVGTRNFLEREPGDALADRAKEIFVSSLR